MNDARELGRQRALAGRAMPAPDELRIAWGLDAEKRAQFRLGYVDGQSSASSTGIRL